MNRLMTSLTAEIMANNGTIDKYMGDGVMAFWNAPLGDADHALNACAAALSMATALDRLNAEALDDARKGMAGAELLRIGVGINTGLCVVGRSEEHTSELQSLMRISYAVLCLKK